MTLKEIRGKLENWKGLIREARRINAELKELETFEVSVSSSIVGKGRGKGSKSSPAEAFVLRLEAKREQLMRKLEQVWKVEDEMAAALDTLTYEEREVIVGAYMNCKTVYKLAEEMGYSIETINRRKLKAIKKILRILKS